MNYQDCRDKLQRLVAAAEAIRLRLERGDLLVRWTYERESKAIHKEIAELAAGLKSCREYMEGKP